MTWPTFQQRLQQMVEMVMMVVLVEMVMRIRKEEIRVKEKLYIYMRHWQLIRSKLGFYSSSGITLDIDVFFFGALPIDQLKIEIPSRHFLENLPEKASIYAFIHLKFIGNLQGFCQYIMADMLNRTIANYRKYSGVVFLGP